MSALTLYIDEAGDPGVRDGLSFLEGRHEWMCVAAVCVRESRADEVVGWVKEMREVAKSTQAGALHYHRINRDRREAVCGKLAEKPCRAFVMASHKSNLREYFNPRIGQMISSGTFYNWCMRLLLERVTAWAESWQLENVGSRESMRVVFANRGHDWEHFFKYVDKLCMQKRTGTLYLKGPGLAVELLDRSDWSVEQAAENAGLQLADVVASAFYQAANTASPAHDMKPALALKPVIPMRDGSAANVGVTLFPLPAQAAVPTNSQRIFEGYGYQF
jgi:hypothetical protein